MKKVVKSINTYFFGVESLEGTNGHLYYILIGGSLVLTLALNVLVRMG